MTIKKQSIFNIFIFKYENDNKLIGFYYVRSLLLVLFSIIIYNYASLNLGIFILLMAMIGMYTDDKASEILNRKNKNKNKK